MYIHTDIHIYIYVHIYVYVYIYQTLREILHGPENSTPLNEDYA